MSRDLSAPLSAFHFHNFSQMSYEETTPICTFPVSMRNQRRQRTMCLCVLGDRCSYLDARLNQQRHRRKSQPFIRFSHTTCCYFSPLLFLFIFIFKEKKIFFKFFYLFIYFFIFFIFFFTLSVISYGLSPSFLLPLAPPHFNAFPISRADVRKILSLAHWLYDSPSKC